MGEWGIIGGGEQSLAIKQDFMFGVNPVFEFNPIIFIFVPFLACFKSRCENGANLQIDYWHCQCVRAHFTTLYREESTQHRLRANNWIGLP